MNIKAKQAMIILMLALGVQNIFLGGVKKLSTIALLELFPVLKSHQKMVCIALGAFGCS